VWSWVVLSWVVLSTAVGCRKDPQPVDVSEPEADPYDVEVGPYEVDVRTTAYGIPHVLADDLGSAGYGMGWALARDHLCTFSDQIVKVRSERSRYYGAGVDGINVDLDFGWLGLRVFEQAESSFLSLPLDQQQVLVAFAAGYSRYLEETPAEQLDPRCRDAEWLVPITHIDLFAYYLHLGQLGSGYNLVREVGTATPPSGRRGAQPPPPPIEVLEPFRDLPIGSNGWAIGADRSETGHGMLLSNTHFPSQGELQWWESHLTVPGELNVYGVSLIGAALVNMGFNEHLAWTHTVSNTDRFVVYQLDLDPADPTVYLYDGESVAMEVTEAEIEVLQEDGTLGTASRKLYRTQWGPVFNAPIVGWSALHAYTWRDVNDGNLGLLGSFGGMNRADDRMAFEVSHQQFQGIPWVHTMMTDVEGTAMYLDSAATPNLSPEAEAGYRAYAESDPVAKIFSGYGIVVVDAKDPLYDWVEDERSVVAGAVPYEEAPRLLRRDFVSNSNENHWLANPSEPLTGYPMLYGETGTPRTPRTKMNNRFLIEIGPGTASGEDGRFSLDELEAAALSGRASLAEDLLTQLVDRCEDVTEPVSVSLDNQNRIVDIGPACTVLSSWDGRASVDSVGAHLWREFVGSELHELVDLGDQGALFADAFDPADPIRTPNQLVEPGPDGDLALEALAAAVYRLEEAGVALDAPLRDVQFTLRGEERFPRLGGNYIEGLISIATYDGRNNTELPFVAQSEVGEVINGSTGLTTGGYYVNSGNSWVMAMQFTDDGPEARAVMVYSQSENPESPHFADQTAIYAEERMRPVLFREEDILADPALEVVHLSL
jgi:acyl-homoserine-lactone acylase